MTEYVVLIVGDADRWWTTMSPERRAAGYAEYARFGQELTDRGHKVTGGAELVHSRGAVVVHNGNGGVAVTEGPYAETVEQLTGFYLVESDDLDDLLQVAAMLAGPQGGVEVRACVDHSGTA